MISRYEEFRDLFERATGSRMWGAQRLWARRLVKGRSFAIIAPTGSGKTTFGMIAAIYFAKRGERVLIVLPTSTLAYQVYKKLVDYVNKLELQDRVRVVMYSSILSKSERETAIKAIRGGDFNILVITNAFLSRFMDVLRPYRFCLIFVDDVDSVLKASSKNVDKILMLLGIDDKILEKALKYIRFVREHLRRRGADDEKIRDEIRALGEEIERLLSRSRVGTLIASGALTKARRTLRAHLFRVLLKFEPGGRIEGIRNVIDVYTEPPDANIVEHVCNIVKSLGDGGIIYVPPDFGRDVIAEIERRLNSLGVKARAYLRPSRSVIDDYSNGEINVLIGLATSRSALVRGIDLPHRVKYVIFAGVPRLRFRLKLSEFSPGRYIALFLGIRNIVDERSREAIDRMIVRLRGVTSVPEYQLSKILTCIQENKMDELSAFERRIANVISEAIRLAKDLLSKVKDESLERSNVIIERVDGDVQIVLPDSVTYIQGSGRSSRLYVGGVTKGLSIVVVDDKRLFRALVRDLKYRLEDVEFKNIRDVDLSKVISEINHERKIVKDVMSGAIPSSIIMEDPLKSVLIVVESPTKARTIARFFGIPNIINVNGLPVFEVATDRYLILVAATKGHIYELVPDASERDMIEYVKHSLGAIPSDYYGVLKMGDLFAPIYSTVKRCPVCGETFTDKSVCPRDGSALADSKLIVESLRDIATEVDIVLLGTDPDSEGEKISWDLYLMLRPYVSNIMRIEFHEVTKRSIANAILNPRSINYNMVCAQLIRRIEDRWIGFGLSQKLWEASKVLVGRELKTLSAGRVQSPVLEWIIHRYYECRESKVYRCTIVLETGHRLVVDIPPDKKGLVRDIVEKKAIVKVKDVREVEVDLNPPPPYTTDSLLSESSNMLRVSVSEVMRILQDLFESGLITYHRTDSTRVSSAGIAIAKDYITRNFSPDLFCPRSWTSSAHIGAHECIRPTRSVDSEELRGLISSGVIQVAARLTNRHFVVYDMIFRRFVASQMVPARVKLQRFKLIITSSDGSEAVELEQEHYVDVVRQGFLSVYNIIKVERPLAEGEYRIVESTKIRTYKVKPLREGDVVAMMRERGIGRPSTYSKIIDVLLRRRYVVAVGRFRYLVPTKMGLKTYYYITGDEIAYKLLLRSKDVSRDSFDVIKSMSEYGKFRGLISEERTRLIEKLMDEVESGSRGYVDVLRELFNEACSYGILRPTCC